MKQAAEEVHRAPAANETAQRKGDEHGRIGQRSSAEAFPFFNAGQRTWDRGHVSVGVGVAAHGEMPSAVLPCSRCFTVDIAQHLALGANGVHVARRGLACVERYRPALHPPQARRLAALDPSAVFVAVGLLVSRSALPKFFALGVSAVAAKAGSPKGLVAFGCVAKLRSSDTFSR